MIADMLPHDREEYRQQMGHVWLGFSADQVRGLLEAAGFERIRIVPAGATPAPKGRRCSWQVGRKADSHQLTASAVS